MIQNTVLSPQLWGDVEGLGGSRVAMGIRAAKFCRTLLPTGSSPDSLAWHSKPSTIQFQSVISLYLPTYHHIRLETRPKRTTHFRASHISL